MTNVKNENKIFFLSPNRLTWSDSTDVLISESFFITVPITGLHATNYRVLQINTVAS